MSDRIAYLIHKLETGEPFKTDDYEVELNEILARQGKTWKYTRPGDRVVIGED